MRDLAANAPLPAYSNQLTPDGRGLDAVLSALQGVPTQGERHDHLYIYVAGRLVEHVEIRSTR
jgi:hypothetical protein